MQSVLDAGQSAVSQCGFPFSVQGTNCGEEPASPEIRPSASFCSHHDPIKLNQASRSHLEKGEQMPLAVATVIYCTSVLSSVSRTMP